MYKSKIFISLFITIIVILTGCVKSTPEDSNSNNDGDVVNHESNKDKCVTESNYKVENGKVFFTRNNRVNEADKKYIEVKIADADSFCPLSEVYAVDMNNVYYEDKILEYADLSSFEIIEHEKIELEPIVWAKDANNIYIDDQIVEDVDYKSFKVIFGGYAKDKNHVYSGSQVFDEIEVSTFQHLGYYLIKDSRKVFCLGQEIIGADPATIEIIPVSSEFVLYSMFPLSKDKDHIYFCNEKTEIDVNNYRLKYFLKGLQIYVESNGLFYVFEIDASLKPEIKKMTKKEFDEYLIEIEKKSNS